MIITVENDGQPFLDNGFVKKAYIPQPEQTYFSGQVPFPGENVHPGLGADYVPSIASGSDAYSDRTLHSRTMDPHLAPANNIWRRLFQSPVSVTKLPWRDPLLSGSTMSLEKQTLIAQRGNPTTFPISWRELGKKWLIAWILLSLLLCSAISCGVWLATRKADRGVLFQKMNSEWSPDGPSIYTLPVERFGCCQEPSHATNNSNFLVVVPSGQDHTFVVQGGSSGHVTLASSPNPSDTSITYDIFIEGNPESLSKFGVVNPGPGPQTDFVINTPTDLNPPGSNGPPSCMRFDITMYVPSNLRKLAVNVSTPVQITFSPQGHVALDQVSINLSSTHPNCRIDSSESLQAKNLTVEMSGGIIHGAISIGDYAQITNWSGQIQLDTIPNVSSDLSNPSTATLSTTTVNGKVDIRYLRNRAHRKRRIESYHTMGTKATSIGRFDYGCSGFNGQLSANTTSYNVTDMSLWGPPGGPPGKPPEKPPNTPTVLGNQTGDDMIYIKAGTGSIILPGHPPL